MSEQREGSVLDFWEDSGANKVDFVARTRHPLECVRRAEQIAGVVEAKFQLAVIAALDLSRENVSAKAQVDEWRRALMKRIRA